MKKSIFIFITYLLGFNLLSCVSHRPSYSSIQDGVRCPLPNKKMAQNTTATSKRSPASAEVNPRIADSCNQLFDR